MLSVIIDLLLIAIVVYCGWMGLKKGFLNGAFGILAVIIAVFCGHLIGTVYCDEFSGMFKPFCSGLVDSAINTVTSDVDETVIITDTEENSKDNKKVPVVILSDTEKTDVYSVSYAALRQLGICNSASEKIATNVASEQTVVDQEMSQKLTLRLCDIFAYVFVTCIVFAIVAIIGAIIGNVLNLYFQLPKLESLNRIAGSVLGVFKGILIITLIACFCRYFGLIISEKIISGTGLFEWLIEHNKIATILGI